MNFEHVERICSDRASKLDPPLCSYAIASWERACSDLDTIHRQGEDKNEDYFIGHKYLLHSTTVIINDNHLQYDFILQRIKTAERWKPLCVCYFADEESPCEADDDYLSEPEEEEEYCEYEGRCSTCQTDAPRNCSECGIGICEGCSFGKTMCKWCILDQGIM